MLVNAIWANKHSCDISEPYGDLFGQPAILMVYHISGLYHLLCSYFKRTFGEALSSALIAMINLTEVATC